MRGIGLEVHDQQEQRTVWYEDDLVILGRGASCKLSFNDVSVKASVWVSLESDGDCRNGLDGNGVSPSCVDVGALAQVFSVIEDLTVELAAEGVGCVFAGACRSANVTSGIGAPPIGDCPWHCQHLLAFHSSAPFLSDGSSAGGGFGSPASSGSDFVFPPNSLKSSVRLSMKATTSQRSCSGRSLNAGIAVPGSPRVMMLKRSCSIGNSPDAVVRNL